MLRLYKPERKDLDYRRSLLSDRDTMAYNEQWGGTIDFPEEKWETWYKKWVLSDENWRYYRYLYSEDIRSFVGEVAYHFDANCQAHIISIIIEATHRGKGYGKEGLSLLIEAAKQNCVTRLCDDIAIDNPCVSLFLNTGFTEAWRNEHCIMVELVL
ncbi:MAG: GNAT family N-acetyltransferase [Oscillospiraceae bacterium]